MDPVPLTAQASDRPSWVPRSEIWWAEGREPITRISSCSAHLSFALLLKFGAVWIRMETAVIHCALSMS